MVPDRASNTQGSIREFRLISREDVSEGLRQDSWKSMKTDIIKSPTPKDRTKEEDISGRKRIIRRMVINVCRNDA
jgi:hypothetical protein